MATKNGKRPGIWQSRLCARIIVATLVALVLAGSAAAQGGGSSTSTYTFTTIDVPGAGTAALQGTLGVNNNAPGDITGIYLTAPNVAHGFVRSAATGTIIPFDSPHAGTSLNQGTFPVRIEQAGNITGMYADSNNAYHGFLRSPNGVITEFDVPGAPTTIAHRGTIALSINASLQITGFYVDANAVRHGFLRAPDGTFTTFDFPGAGTFPTQGTMALRINGGGGIAGSYVDANEVFHGFIRTFNGTMIGPFDDPGASTARGKGIRFGGTVVHGNDAGIIIVGIYTDANLVFHGFMTDLSRMTFTNIDVPGASAAGLFPGTIPTYLDGAGNVTGTYSDANGVAHGFVLLFGASSISAPVDAPGAAKAGLFAGTVPFSINPLGEVTGTYTDANGVFHGFLATPGVAAPTITSISPASAIAGGPAFTLNANGTNFLSGSTVNFNGNALATTFVSATQLIAVVPAASITLAGSFNVVVTNPGGQTSSALSFTVVTPQQATQAITDSVNSLFSQGIINGGQDNSLVGQLQHAITMMNAGKNNGAIGNLDSFISEVNDLLSSVVLSPAQAASLVNAAQSIVIVL